MMNPQRIAWIDTIKAFSILAVVLNHTQIVPSVQKVAYLLCLPAFFFASGMFTNTRLTVKEFFIKKTLRLLIPFLFWGVVSWAAWCLIGRHYGADADDSTAWWEPLWGMVCGLTDGMVHNPPLWFLCAMMGLEWLYYAIRRIEKAWLRWVVIAGFALLGCVTSYLGKDLVWEFSAAMIILPLYAFGAEYGMVIREKAASLTSLMLGLIMVLSVAGVWMGSVWNDDIALAHTRIGNPLLYYISVLCVVGLWFSLSLLLERSPLPMRGLHYIGQNTLLVLCTHMPIFGFLKGIALCCGVSLSYFNTTAGSLILWIGAFVVALPAAAFINRFCPLLVGKLPQCSTP